MNLANDLLRRRPIIPEECIIGADGFEIASMDSVELLDLQERAICTRFKILPRHFNLLKYRYASLGTSMAMIYFG